MNEEFDRFSHTASGNPDPSARKQDAGPLDWHHLRAMTLADAALQREVLMLFRDQGRDIMAALRGQPENAAVLAHTLKGAARAIGALRVAAAASRLEGAIGAGSDASQPLVRDLVSRLAVEIDTVGEVIAQFLQDDHTS